MIVTENYEDDRAIKPDDLDFDDILQGDGARHVLSRPFHSLCVSMSMILLSEVGDKTFIVAALMAMQHPRLTIFISAFSSLALMSLLSGLIGHIAQGAVGHKWTSLIAGILFLLFGAKLFIEGYRMPTGTDTVKEEIVQVEQELRDATIDEESGLPSSAVKEKGMEEAGVDGGEKKSLFANAITRVQAFLSMCASPAFAQTFVMTFLSEWGDRSQVATIVMAAGPYFWWVTWGAIIGHLICTGIAVMGGRLLASRISIRKITLGGATLFVLFGILYLHEASLQASF